MSAKILTPVKQPSGTAPRAPQAFLAPRGQAPVPAARPVVERKPEVTHEQLREAFNQTLKAPDDKALVSRFLKLFVDAQDPNFRLEQDKSPLYVAVAKERLDLVRAFVARKDYNHGEVNASGNTVLFTAVIIEKSKRTENPFEFVSELLKVVPVGKKNLKDLTIQASVEKDIRVLAKAEPDRVQYLKDVVLPAIQAKVAEDQAAFEAEYQRRLAPLMRRAALKEKMEIEGFLQPLYDTKTKEQMTQKLKEGNLKHREALAKDLKDLMELKREHEMDTNKDRVARVGTELQKLEEIFNQRVDRLPEETQNGSTKQLSGSPTKEYDNAGTLLK